jgi:copper chaperone CopZ
MHLAGSLKRKVFVLVAVLLAAGLGASAQVEKVEILTSGVSCGVCAAVSEFHFRRMPGISKVAISLSNESITLTYKPDAEFSTQAIRQVLDPLKVDILRLRIEARGRVEDSKQGTSFFVAGRFKAALRLKAGMSAPPSGTPLSVEGILNEGVSPAELRVIKISPLEKQPSR